MNKVNSITRRSHLWPALLLFVITTPLFTEESAFVENKTIPGLESGMRYSSQSREGASIRSFSIPIALPLEASSGNFLFKGAINYTKKEYERGDLKESVEGASHLNVGGKFRAINDRNYKLTVSETINVPLQTNKNADLPPEAWLHSGNYGIDSGLSFTYFFQRSSLKFDLEHNWNFARNDFEKGESFKAAIILGYGIGNSLSPANYKPVELLLGITSRYSYPDRYKSEELAGTETNTLFISPGLQLSSSAVDFWASFEVPIKHQQAPTSTKEGPRGSIGIKYQLK